jgi:hypothetical protein
MHQAECPERGRTRWLDRRLANDDFRGGCVVRDSRARPGFRRRCAPTRPRFARAAQFFEATPAAGPGFPVHASASAGPPGAVAPSEPADELVELARLTLPGAPASSREVERAVGPRADHLGADRPRQEDGQDPRLDRHRRRIAFLPRAGNDLGHLIEAEAELPLDLLHGWQGAPLRMREPGARMGQLREGYVPSASVIGPLRALLSGLPGMARGV